MSRMTKTERIQLWLDRLNRQSASHQSVAEFCGYEEISVPSFYQWKRRLAPRVDSPPKRRKGKLAASPRFTELVVGSASREVKKLERAFWSLKTGWQQVENPRFRSRSYRCWLETRVIGASRLTSRSVDYA